MQIRPVPQQRIREKMDAYMSRRDYAGAERHLLYWLEEARQGQDLRGQLMLRNELIGHYRKTADRENAFSNIEEALKLLKEMQFENSISAGTTYVNAATACNAFGENKKALELFEKARTVYEAGEDTEPQLLAGLYNNMALVCVALGKKEKEICTASDRNETAGSGTGPAGSGTGPAGSGTGPADSGTEPADSGTEPEGSGTGPADRGTGPEGSGTGPADRGTGPAEAWFAQAFELYEKALEQMRQAPHGELEQAITCLNMADALEGRDGPEAAEHPISELLDTAYDLLQTPSVPRDGYYAFVCEKCAPAFSYYGYFLAAEELRKTAEDLYAREQAGRQTETEK